MVRYHFNNGFSHTQLLSNIGHEVKGVAEIAAAVKGMYDVGKMLYNGVCAIGVVASTVGLLTQQYLVISSII